MTWTRPVGQHQMFWRMVSQTHRTPKSTAVGSIQSIHHGEEGWLVGARRNAVGWTRLRRATPERASETGGTSGPAGTAGQSGQLGQQRRGLGGWGVKWGVVLWGG